MPEIAVDYPKYSVLMSLYEKECPDYFRVAMDSMLGQTIKPDEIVIVEDGPLTDALYAVLDEYAKKSDVPIKTVKNAENFGLGFSLNVGLKACRNEFIARMDTDDISMPERCKKQLDVFALHPELSIVGAFVDEFYNDPKKIESTRIVPKTNDAIYQFAKKRSAFNHSVVMFRKSKVLEFGGYANLRRNQDVDLFGRMLFGGCKAENVGESLLFFRCNKALAKRRKSWENTKSYIETIRKFHKMGYSSFMDYAKVAVAQTAVFLMAPKIQRWVYRKLLRK